MAKFLESDFFKNMDNYDAKEQAFLRGFLAKHSTIQDGFDKYVGIAANQRLERAHKDLNKVPRAAWENIKAPEVQTVGQHVDGMHEVAYDLGLDDEKIHKMIDLHDLCEVIVGDIPNHAKEADRDISEEEKREIELLAAKLLFEAFHEEYEIFMEYEARETDAAKLTKAADIIEFMRSINATEREVGAPQAFAEFRRTAAKRLNETFGGKEQVPVGILQHIDEMVTNANGPDTDLPSTAK